jgi:hypothetical protein
VGGLSYGFVLYSLLLFPDELKPVLGARSLLGHNGNQLNTLLLSPDPDRRLKPSCLFTLLRPFNAGLSIDTAANLSAHRLLHVTAA